LKPTLLAAFVVLLASCNPKLTNGLRKNDLKKDVSMVTDHGTIVLRLSDSTPGHRDNFLKLVKTKFYDSILFHRVIQGFMIQAGNPSTRTVSLAANVKKEENSYTIPAEFVPSLFHRKGAVAMARTGDDVNPLKASSGSQFYIVQGKTFTDMQLDSVERARLKGNKLPLQHREVYKNIGGTPQLDMNYTVFGTVIKGMAVVDSIAAEPTSGQTGGDKPLKEVRILKAFLVKRK